MSLFLVYADGTLFCHPQMSKRAITAVRIEEDAESIDSMTISAPFSHPYLSGIRPLASAIIRKRAVPWTSKAVRREQEKLAGRTKDSVELFNTV